MMSSLCLYASYVEGIGLPYYSEIYLSELKKHCVKVIYIYSNKLDVKATDFLKKEGIEQLKVSNEGYDFGKWKKALALVDLNEYDQLFLINDSCILFAPLDNILHWFKNSSSDFGGLTESLYPEKHIQSYFLLFKKSTFYELTSFFKLNEPSSYIHDVIRDFEIGLSQYLISKNYACSSFLSNNGYNGEFAPYYQCIDSHIEQGSPMIKKKILFSSYRKEELFTLARMNFTISVPHYIKLINKKHKLPILSFEKLLLPGCNQLNAFNRIKYTITKTLIKLYRYIRR